MVAFLGRVACHPDIRVIIGAALNESSEFLLA